MKTQLLADSRNVGGGNALCSRGRLLAVHNARYTLERDAFRIVYSLSFGNSWRIRRTQPPAREDALNKVCPFILASVPASLLNQHRADSGIPNRINLISLRSSRNPGSAVCAKISD
jgi:hypothetical protein